MNVRDIIDSVNFSLNEKVIKITQDKEDAVKRESRKWFLFVCIVIVLWIGDHCLNK